MANSLDELTGPVNPEGRDINVIHKQLPVEVGFGTTLFQIGVWLAVPLIGTIIALAVPDLEPKWAYILGACGIGVVCGLILQYMKTKAQNYFQQLEQKIQAEASNIDNYMEQRVVILENLVGLVNRAINLDKDVMESVAALRSGIRQSPMPSSRIATSRRKSLQHAPSITTAYISGIVIFTTGL